MSKVTFLAAADPHYTTKPASGDRRHALSLEKLKRAVTAAAPRCDFLVNLGDSTDSAPGYLPQQECFRRVTEVLASGGKPFYSVIGNHDTGVRKAEAVRLSAMPDRYYAVTAGGFRCLFLDGSLNDPDDPDPRSIIDWEACVIDREQLSWLSLELNESRLPVLVFCHPCFALKPGWNQYLHLLKNRERLMSLFSGCGKVAAVFSGHYHSGDVEIVDGIPYVTVAAMCVGEADTWAVVTVNDREVLVEGSGSQPSFRVPTGLSGKG